MPTDPATACKVLAMVVMVLLLIWYLGDEVW